MADLSRMYRETDPDNLTAAPQDEEAKRMLIENLIRLPEARLRARLARQAREGRAPTANKPGLTDNPEVITRVLDTTGGTTGNVLPRVDLEPTVYALFVAA